MVKRRIATWKAKESSSIIDMPKLKYNDIPVNNDSAEPAPDDTSLFQDINYVNIQSFNMNICRNNDCCYFSY